MKGRNIQVLLVLTIAAVAAMQFAFRRQNAEANHMIEKAGCNSMTSLPSLRLRRHLRNSVLDQTPDPGRRPSSVCESRIRADYDFRFSSIVSNCSCWISASRCHWLLIR